MSNKPSLSSGMPNKLNDKKAKFRKVQLHFNTLQFFLAYRRSLSVWRTTDYSWNITSTLDTPVFG